MIEETLPSAKPTAPILEMGTFPNLGALLRAPSEPADARRDGWLEETLEIAADEIEIHPIGTVKFKATRHSVRRHCWKKIENPDF